MTLREKRLIAIAAYNTDKELVDIDYAEDENTRCGCLVLHKGITRVYSLVEYSSPEYFFMERDYSGRLVRAPKNFIKRKQLWFEF